MFPHTANKTNDRTMQTPVQEYSIREFYLFNVQGIQPHDRHWRYVEVIETEGRLVLKGTVRQSMVRDASKSSNMLSIFKHQSCILC